MPPHLTPKLTPANIITHLSLQPHPEGGHFVETFRDIPSSTNGAAPRPISTLIYYLLTFPDFSALHRLDAAEVWHYYGGNAPLEVVELVKGGDGDGDSGKGKGRGEVKISRLGMDLEGGERPQCVVEKGRWFGARVGEREGGKGEEDGGRWALVGCTVAPGFVFEKFEMGKREELVREFPGCDEVIGELTRG
jgi:uncharacterized protein